MRQMLAAIFLLLMNAAPVAEGVSRHLFILSGQSNMARLDPEDIFMPLLQAALPGDQLIVIKDAQGGQPIRRWYQTLEPSVAVSGQPESRGPLYQQLLRKITAETGDLPAIDSVTFIWMQGERDAREGAGELYEDKLRGLIANLQADLGRDDICLVIGRISDHGLDGPSSMDWHRVREAQMRVAESLPFAVWVDTDDLNDGLDANGKLRVDDLHLTEKGYQELGRRFATVAIRLLRRSNAESADAQENRRPVVQN